MVLEIEINKCRFLNDIAYITSDKEIAVESLVKNVFERAPLARIGFDAEESAHMGYDSYDIYKDSSIDNVIKDIGRGIVFTIRIELPEGFISSSTYNISEYSFSMVEEMSEEEIGKLFEELLK